MRSELTRSNRDGTQRVSVRPAASQSEADVEREFERSFEYGERLLAGGVKGYHSWYKRYGGRIKVMASKEVGPPPWPWPKLKVHGSRGPLFVSFGAGWRSTLYSLHIMVK
jgi:hypothetical protein